MTDSSSDYQSFSTPGLKRARVMLALLRHQTRNHIPAEWRCSNVCPDIDKRFDNEVEVEETIVQKTEAAQYNSV